MFGTLGGPELFLIFVVALIVFGPRKLPEIGKSLGKMMAEFRRASNDFRNTIESEVEAEKIRESLRIEPPRVDIVRQRQRVAREVARRIDSHVEYRPIVARLPRRRGRGNQRSGRG